MQIQHRKQFIGIGRAVLLLMVFIAVLFAATPEVHADEPTEGDPAGTPLPVINITIDESRGTIDAMNNSEDHSVSCYGTLSITVPEGFRYSEKPDLELTEVTDLPMSMHGRGNSTWQQANKKPYKIKLDKKENLLGLGKNKHYVLLANAMESSLMRNRLASYLAGQMGMEYTPQCQPVDVYMNGEYLGNYTLSGGVRVGENRVDIDDPKETATDPAEITGGYLVQGGQQKDPDSPSYFSTERGESFANHTPNFDPEDGGYENDAQKSYIRNYLQTVEDALFSPDYTDTDGRRYSDRMDLTSGAAYWLIQQVSANPDAFLTGSTYLYKKKDTETGEGKLYWGPAWDFDVAWGATSSDWDPEEPEDADEHVIQDYDGFFLGTCWVDAMLSDPEFRKEIYAQWPVVRDTLSAATADGGMIDVWYQEMKASQTKDFEKWHPGREDRYQLHVDILKKWINARVDWMDQHLSELEDAVCRITLKADGQPDRIFYKPTGRDFYLEYVDKVEKEGYLFLGWLDEEGNPVSESVIADRDRILTADLVRVDGVSYSCKDGANASWKKDSGKKLVIKFERSYQDEETMRLFTGITVDGKKLETSLYTTAEGCVEIQLSSEFLETLETGKHTLTAEFLDGTGKTDFTVLAADEQKDDPKEKEEKDKEKGKEEEKEERRETETPEEQESPKDGTDQHEDKKQDTKEEKVQPVTGDDSPIELWAGIFILSLAGTAGVLALKRYWR